MPTTTPTPHTPKSGEVFTHIIDTLNDQFSLEIPNPRVFSPGQNKTLYQTVPWRIYNGLKRLYYHKQVDLNKLLNSFEEWVCSRNAKDAVAILARRQRGASAPLRATIAITEKEERLAYLARLVADELYLLDNGFYPAIREVSAPSTVVKAKGNSELRSNGNSNACDIARGNKHRSPERPLKRRLSASVSGEESHSSDEFHTAPNSPVKGFNADGVESFDDHDYDYDLNAHQVAKKKTAGVLKNGASSSSFVDRLTGASEKSMRYDAVTTAQNRANFSFSTFTATADAPPSYLIDSRIGGFQKSFDTTVTFTDSGSTYDDSVVAHMLSEEATMPFTSTGGSSEMPRYSAEGEIVTALLQDGPFSLKHTLPGTIPLLYRYELERIGRAWDVPLNRMLAGDSISLRYDEFWKWIEGHGQRDGKSIPEKPTRKAWEAAAGGTFRTDKLSEAVVLTGDLDWCDKSEPGVLKLTLKPLKTERSCRFHRRFGSDRFLSLTLPAPSRPPNHLRLPKNPALLRESIALWLAQTTHECVGRTWRPFYVEEVKQKRKIRTEPKFRVEFFAVDGIDFVGRFSPSFDDTSHRTSAKSETAGSHTPMSLASLLEWHLSPQANKGQTNLKLFQRMSLGLSKTYATVALKPKQVFYLRDEPNHRVMNDGCALMSRTLANQICDALGIAGNTPSAFQGRIAGAKGLWMVDAHQSQITTDDDIWIQISDSQLKIHPHPRKWKGPIDDEKLTFEVVKWSKPPHPVDLNIQLLAILDHGGHVKDYVADLARKGIQAVAGDFEEVLKSNSPVLCRSLAQKIRPTSDAVAGNMMQQSMRRLEQWMTDDVEAIVRFSEAGFAPRDFYPLRKRLGRCLRDLLARYVEELRIEVPLSTYAFCIADPYGVLKEDEVHFGLSNNWRDDHGQFEDNLLDGIDVLVGRLPAHLPSDIQRRRAVWKPELRHFKDVIVFPTTGDHPLADMLSGGDYDGDTPWICWDQHIVRSFHNSQPPSGTENYPPDYFGLSKHSVPMEEIQSMDEFLESSFAFNLTLSNLGRCTVEHEKLSYDESIDSTHAKELSILLSHLVDGRKAGVHLSEDAWQKYRKKISPRVRELPAYKNPERKPRRNNIIDYIRFVVSRDARNEVLTKLQKAFPQEENSHTRDPDLVQPWNDVCEKAKAEKAKIEKSKNQRHNDDESLYAVLKAITREVDKFQRKWNDSISRCGGSFSPQADEAAEQARALRPPTIGNHPIIHVWRHSQSAWFELLASYAYRKAPSSSFVLHAFGEYLCQIKSRTVPSRTVTHETLACYRVNKKVIARLQVQDGAEEEENDGDEYEGHEAIEAMLYGTPTTGVGGYYDPDDQMSVE
ncbi:RNA dependent RNA polymerase [Aspergillus mulundensis]|uniref:RNA-dependent RNA polymerase n=1 Tax=Aspergillus mulundensis TaxID=1810919 RepID=A0A3D8QJ92_9EURO|nr:Uncharacterized protein DSM5745_10547 [Aspergillus mulundensis]RDW61875.1 Uncharacterized protein DSM5745_10547 [Aspergillus mulundensis]